MNDTIEQFKQAGFIVDNITFQFKKTNPNLKEVKQHLDDALREAVKQGDCTVTIETGRTPRTKQQNRYYWKLIGILANYAGYHKEDISDYFMNGLGLTRTAKTWEGETEKIMSTTKLNTKQFSVLIDAVIGRLEANGLAYQQPDYYGFDENE
jgi:hypothetical protein